MSSPIELYNKEEVSNTLNPLNIFQAGKETSKSAAMGFRSSISVARTTRFKRKLATPFTPPATPFTPPATPFNNTSFLMHLQQQRERHNHNCPSPTQKSPFDQYGSMDTFIALSFATPASPQNHHSISGVLLHPCQSVNACSQNAECSTLEQKGSRSPGGRICRSESDHRGRVLPHVSSCSHGACSGITELKTPEKIETDPEMCEEDDGKSTPRHRHQFTNLNIDIRAQSPGSGGAWRDLACKVSSL